MWLVYVISNLNSCLFHTFPYSVRLFCDLVETENIMTIHFQKKSFCKFCGCFSRTSIEEEGPHLLWYKQLHLFSFLVTLWLF